MMQDPNQKKCASYISAVDLFCGAGGLSYGLRSVGIDIAAGVDLDPHSRYPFEANCSARHICRDVSSLTVDELRGWFGDAPVRVLAGCAPCQPFSSYSQSRKTNRGTAGTDAVSFCSYFLFHRVLFRIVIFLSLNCVSCIDRYIFKFRKIIFRFRKVFIK